MAATDKRELRRSLDLLGKYLSYDERSDAAWARFRRRPDTATGRREQELAERWDVKAVAAWDEAIAIIRRQSEA